jgi:PKD repeat protein
MEFVRVVPCPRFADFIAEPTVGVGTTTVQFTDKSTGNVTSWAWDFESDGIIDSTEQNASHIYSKNGNYTVTLTIATPECSDTITKWDYISITGCHT